jgi:hypothetical protein
MIAAVPTSLTLRTVALACGRVERGRATPAAPKVTPLTAQDYIDISSC